MIRFNCPNCAVALKVPDDHAGQQIKCPKCQRPVAVPENLNEETPVAEHEPTEPQEAPAAEQNKRRRFLPRWAWLAVALAFLSVPALALVLAVIKRAEPKDGLTRTERAELEVKRTGPADHVIDV